MTAPSTTRGPMGYVAAIFAGGVSAALFAVALAKAETLLIFLTYLTAIPLFIAGLGVGSLGGLIGSLTGTFALFVTAPSNFAFIYAFVFAVPSIALTALALRYRVAADEKVYWYPEGYLLTAIAIYPCIMFLAIAGLMSGHDGGLLAITTDAFKDMADEISTKLPTDKAVMIHATLESLARVAPAMVGCTWLLMTVIGMVASQSLLKQNKWSLRADFTLTGLHVPNWLIYAVAITGAVGVLLPAPYDYIGKNLSIILGLPFFFVGLSVIHAWAATTRMPTMALVIFYVILSLLIWLVLLVALVGVVDQWIDFRQRMQRTKKA